MLSLSYLRTYSNKLFSKAELYQNLAKKSGLYVRGGPVIKISFFNSYISAYLCRKLIVIEIIIFRKPVITFQFSTVPRASPWDVLLLLKVKRRTPVSFLTITKIKTHFTSSTTSISQLCITMVSMEVTKATVWSKLGLSKIFDFFI